MISSKKFSYQTGKNYGNLKGAYGINIRIIVSRSYTKNMLTILKVIS